MEWCTDKTIITNRVQQWKESLESNSIFNMLLYLDLNTINNVFCKNSSYKMVINVEQSSNTNISQTLLDNSVSCLYELHHC